MLKKNIPFEKIAWLNIVVCGKFHYENYALNLQELGALKCLYFSHKRTSFSKIPKQNKVNHPLKEVLLHLHLYLIKEFALSHLLPIYHWIWELELSRSFVAAPVNLFLLHGNCRRAMLIARSQGNIVVGEAVNAHPNQLQTTLLNEAKLFHLSNQDADEGGKKIIRDAKLCDYLLTPSFSVKESYVKEGFDPERIFVLPYGLNKKINSVSRVRHLKGNFNLLYVGQIFLRKGLHRYIQFLRDNQALLPIKTIDLTLVGRPNPDYLAALREQNYPFHHISHIANNEMIEYMKNFDALILPSIEDGFGMVVVEAMAAGIPVLVSKHAGASDLVNEIGGGYIFDPFDEKSMFNALKNCMENGPPPVKCVDLSWAMYSQKLLQILSKVRNEHNPIAA